LEANDAGHYPLEFTPWVDGPYSFDLIQRAVSVEHLGPTDEDPGPEVSERRRVTLIISTLELSRENEDTCLGGE
jgi:hypothetical protein